METVEREAVDKETLYAGHIEKYLLHRKDVFAQQLPDGTYKVHRRAITREDIVKHLKGEWTLGVYNLTPDGTVSWCCWDLDDGKVATLYRLTGNIRGDYVVEKTRRGWHVWQAFTKPESAGEVRAYGNLVMDRSGIKDVEFFPKQDAIAAKGFGNLVRLPYGIHQKDGSKSRHVYGEWRPNDFKTLLPADTVIAPAQRITHIAPRTNTADSSWIGEIFGGLSEGDRNNKLNRLAYWLQARGFPQDAVEAVLHVANTYCSPPLTTDELKLLSRPRGL